MHLFDSRSLLSNSISKKEFNHTNCQGGEEQSSSTIEAGCRSARPRGPRRKIGSGMEISASYGE